MEELEGGRDILGRVYSVWRLEAREPLCCAGCQEHWDEEDTERECAEDRGKVTVGLGSRVMKHELMLEERETPAFKERSDAFRLALLVGLA